MHSSNHFAALALLLLFGCVLLGTIGAAALLLIPLLLVATAIVAAAGLVALSGVFGLVGMVRLLHCGIQASESRLSARRLGARRHASCSLPSELIPSETPGGRGSEAAPGDPSAARPPGE